MLDDFTKAGTYVTFGILTSGLWYALPRAEENIGTTTAVYNLKGNDCPCYMKFRDPTTWYSRCEGNPCAWDWSLGMPSYKMCTNPPPPPNPAPPPPYPPEWVYKTCEIDGVMQPILCTPQGRYCKDPYHRSTLPQWQADLCDAHNPDPRFPCPTVPECTGGEGPPNDPCDPICYLPPPPSIPPSPPRFHLGPINRRPLLLYRRLLHHLRSYHRTPLLLHQAHHLQAHRLTHTPRREQSHVTRPTSLHRLGQETGCRMPGGQMGSLTALDLPQKRG